MTLLKGLPILSKNAIDSARQPVDRVSMDLSNASNESPLIAKSSSRLFRYSS